MQIRQKREIDLTDFGSEGTIVIEPLTFSRKTQWRNNMGKASHYSADSKGANVKIESQDIGDLLIYKILAYITEAPFKLNSVESFSRFMDRLDETEIGASDRLFKVLNDEIDNLKDGGDSPLPNSADAEMSASERENCSSQY